MIDPEQLLGQFEGKLAQAQAESDAIRQNLAQLRVTERSPDGQIVVTVNVARKRREQRGRADQPLQDG